MTDPRNYEYVRRGEALGGAAGDGSLASGMMLCSSACA